MMSDTHKTIQYNLRLSPDLREQIKQSAKENGRSMNQDIVARLENSFLQDGATSRAEEIRDYGLDVRVFDIGDGIKRIVHGKMLDIFNVDYSHKKLSDVKKELEQTISAIKKSPTLKQRLQLFNKNILVYQGGHHLDIVNKGIGSLNWLIVEDHLVDLDKLSEYKPHE